MDGRRQGDKWLDRQTDANDCNTPQAQVVRMVIFYGDDIQKIFNIVQQYLTLTSKIQTSLTSSFQTCGSLISSY